MKSLIMVGMLLNQPGTSFHGSGKDFGKGYQVTSQGEIKGTGKEIFKDWKPDGRGGYYGTGKNWGRRWKP